MYVGDRDTANDVFCQDCGRIADRATLNSEGFCEDCRPFGLVFHAIPKAIVEIATPTPEFWQAWRENRKQIDENLHLTKYFGKWAVVRTEE